MAKDGTNRGVRRVRAGSKPDSLLDKIAAGKSAKVMKAETPEVTLLVGADIGEGADLDGMDMPEPGEYLSAKQKDGQPFYADELYRETWQWLKERGCETLVSPRLIEAYSNPDSSLFGKWIFYLFLRDLVCLTLTRRCRKPCGIRPLRVRG